MSVLSRGRQAGILTAVALLALLFAAAVGWIVYNRIGVTPVGWIAGWLFMLIVGALLAAGIALYRKNIALRAQIRRSERESGMRVAERTRRLNALYEISDEISSHLDVDTVLRSVTEKARQLLDSDVAFICLQGERDDLLHVRSITGPAAAVCDRCTPLNAPLAARILAEQQAVLCSAPECHNSCGVIAPPYQRSHLAAPLRVQNTVIGALCVGCTDIDHFSDDDQRLLTKLANSAAIALENARLYDEVERAATLEERQRIAAAMHDDVLQSLSYLRLKLHQVTVHIGDGNDAEQALALEQLGDRIDDIAQDIREGIADLRAPPARAQPLGPRLHTLIDSLVTQVEQPIAANFDALPALAMPADEAEQVVRIVQEAVLNAARHAGAGSIVVRAARNDAEATLTISDDGAGFDPGTPLTDGNHFGLKIMQARTERIGGRLEITSSPGAGTEVSLRWPLDDEAVKGYAQ